MKLIISLLLSLLPLLLWGNENSEKDFNISSINSPSIVSGSILFKTYEKAIVRIRGVFSEVDDDINTTLNLQIGSGFFINTAGEILTTATVALNANRVWVEHMGIKYPAKFCSADPETNIALLKILELPKDFTYIPLIAQTPLPLIGENIYNLTAPFECKTSFNQGYINAYEGSYNKHIFPVYHLRGNVGQYPGEGGSPVFDIYGRCIGMVTHIASALNASYITPIATVSYVKEQLSLHTKIPHGYLGIELSTEETTGQSPETLITKIIPHSPAANAGLRANDEIIQINDHCIHHMTDIRHATFTLQPGQIIQITVKRQGQIKNFHIQLE